MKRSKLIQIIKEEVNREIIIEGIIDKLLWLFLSPKVKKDVSKLKGTPEWKELVQKINTTRDEFDFFNKRFEKRLEDCKKMVTRSKKMGYDIGDCSDLEKYKK